MKTIQRNTEVVSISLPKNIARKLDQARSMRGQSRSAYVASLINQQIQEENWQKMYTWGKETAKKFRITSEDDIDRILHEDNS